MSLLPAIRVRPFQDESPASVILRSSSLNGYKTPIKQLNQLIGLRNVSLSPSLQTIVGNPKQFELACEVLGVDTTYLESIKPVREHEYPHANYFIGGIYARRKHVSKFSRYCPQCLQDKQYFRRIWDYELYTSCHEHHIELIDRCAVCQERIKWDRQHYMRCQCGEELAFTQKNSLEFQGSELLFKIYRTGDKDLFQQLMDFSVTVAEHYKIDRYSSKVIEDAALGIESPERLAKKIALDFETINGVTLHPILSFQAFTASENPNVRKVAESASKLVLNDSKISSKTRLAEVDQVSLSTASHLLGIKPDETKKLCAAGLLETFQYTPIGRYPITKRSIHNLIMSLANLVTKEQLPALSIGEILLAAEHCFQDYTLESLISSVLNDELKIIDFSLEQPLRNSIIELPELTPLPRTDTLPLVWISDLARTLGVHANELRLLINTTKGVSHFEGANIALKSKRKFLIPSQAYRLLKIVQSRKTDVGVQKLTKRDIPITHVDVQRLETAPSGYLENDIFKIIQLP